MKFSLGSILFISILCGFGVSLTRDTHALSANNLKINFCASKETNAFSDTWTCSADTGSNSVPVTISWETDQIPDSALKVEYGIGNFANSAPASLISTNVYQADLRGLVPSRTYSFRIVSASNTIVQNASTFRTLIAEGIMRHRQGFELRVQATNDMSTGTPILKWQVPNIIASRRGPTCTNTIAWRTTGFDCFIGDTVNLPDTPCDSIFSGNYKENEWCGVTHTTYVEAFSKGWHTYDGSTGSLSDNDNSSTVKSVIVYPPNPASFEHEVSIVPNTISLRRGSSVTLQARIKNISEPEVAPQATQFNPSSILGLPTGITAGAGGSCTPPPNATCDISFTITSDMSIALGTITLPLLKITILPPLPGIAISSTQFDDSLVFRDAIIQGTKHPDISFMISNPVPESPPFTYEISVDPGAQSWLSVGLVTGTLCRSENPGCDAPQVPVAISFSSERLGVRTAPYVGTVTIRDRDPDNTANQKQIRIELMVSNVSDFSLAVTAPTTLVQGNSVGAKITITRTTGIASNITLSVSGLPSGVAGTFTPASCPASSLATPCNSVFTLTADQNAALGPRTIIITASKPADANGPARERKMNNPGLTPQGIVVE